MQCIASSSLTNRDDGAVAVPVGIVIVWRLVYAEGMRNVENRDQ
jgi:hypothetical protein